MLVIGGLSVIGLQLISCAMCTATVKIVLINSLQQRLKNFAVG